MARLGLWPFMVCSKSSFNPVQFEFSFPHACQFSTEPFSATANRCAFTNLFSDLCRIEERSACTKSAIRTSLIPSTKDSSMTALILQPGWTGTHSQATAARSKQHVRDIDRRQRCTCLHWMHHSEENNTGRGFDRRFSATSRHHCDCGRLAWLWFFGFCLLVVSINIKCKKNW